MGPELASLRSFQILFGSNLKVVNIAEVSFKRGDDGSVCWIFFFKSAVEIKYILHLCENIFF